MATLTVLSRGTVSVQKQEDVGEFSGFLQLGGEEGRGGAQLAASAFLRFLPAPAGLLRTQPCHALHLGANPWPWKDSVDWDVGPVKDALGQQFSECLLQLSSRAYIF